MQSDAYVNRPVLNAGLPPMDNPPDLETPQACLANFVDSCEAQDYRPRRPVAESQRRPARPPGNAMARRWPGN